jgi:hypothetical protein
MPVRPEDVGLSSRTFDFRGQLQAIVYGALTDAA